MFWPLEKSLGSFIQSFQLQRSDRQISSQRFCTAVYGAGLWKEAVPWFTMSYINSIKLWLCGYWGGVCFTPGNKCSVCLGMSINKISSLIAIDLFIHCNTVQQNPALLLCHSPCSNNSRALTKSILHSKLRISDGDKPLWNSQQLQLSTGIPRGHSPSIRIAVDKWLMFTFASSIICCCMRRENLSLLSFYLNSTMKNKASPKWKCKLRYPIGYEACLQPAEMLSSTVIGFA